MKIISCYLENFASYEKLEFNFDAQGLALIEGATGSGKSTLCDAIPWGLFGVTAKNGKADEVVSWNGGITKAKVTLQLGADLAIQVTRTRGPKANDLYYSLYNDKLYKPEDIIPNPRGKDLQDTQRIINDLIGMNADLYLAGAYFHEFSQTAQFFTTSAKNRRAITENLVDLSLPIKLQDKIKIKTKDIATETDTLNVSLNQLTAKIQALDGVLEDTKHKNDSWSHEILNRISALQSKADSFDIAKSYKIASLTLEVDELERTVPKVVDLTKTPKTQTCKACGKVSENLKRKELELELVKQQQHEHKLDQALTKLDEAKHSENTYQTQIQDFKAQTNPYTATLLKVSKEIETLSSNQAKTEHTLNQLIDQKLNLGILSDVIQEFRAELIRNTIEDLEEQTNQLLYNHFEGEISVGFTITDTDKLDVSITKDSNQAAYTQLSKGQRQMLKLCFGVAVMKCVAKHHALDLRQVWLDECADGCDDNTKLKVLKMLEVLALDYDSVYVVEHSETFKAMVSTKFKVELIEGRSIITTE